MMCTVPIHPNERFLTDFIHKVIPTLTDIQLRNISAICLGLLSGIPDKSISSMSRALIIPKDQSNLNRSLTGSNWGCETAAIDLNKVRLLQQYKQTRFKSGGYFIIDDSLVKKSGMWMELVHEHFDHCSFTMENGLSLVSINYADDVKSYNLLKDVYLRKSYLERQGQQHLFKTKVEIAREFIETLVENFPSIKEKNLTFLFDSWFLAKSIVSVLDKHNLKYISRAKSNRVIPGLGMSLKEYASTVLKSSDFKEFKIERNGKIERVFAYRCILPISNLGDVNVCFVKNKSTDPVKAFIVSNNLKLLESELIKHYKERWSIETDYKNTKQYLGLGDFHIRKKEGILRYLTLCFLMSAYLEYLRLLGIFGHCYGPDLDLSTKGKQIEAYRHLMFERFLIWVDMQYKDGKNLEELLIYFRRNECSTNKKNIQFLLYNTELSFKKGVVYM
ncbi:MAG: transposase [Promethearchaeota archaeon]